MNKCLRIIKRSLKSKEARFDYLASIGFYNKMPDKEFLKKRFKLKVGYELNLDNPITFNEKIQWLKLYDRNPQYTIMVDKYLVRQYISEKLGKEYLIPLLGVWNTFEDINFNGLPNQFVLKCTHDSGGLVICKDKESLNLKDAEKKIKQSLKRNFYYYGREWPYKNVHPRIIAEKYMADEFEKELKDYKMMCFNGKVLCSFVCTERYSNDGLKVTFFDKDWKVMPFERHYPKSKKIIEIPKKYDEMIYLAEKLAKNIPFVRVDFYEIEERIYFGEITFYPGNGMEEFSPEEWDYKLGSWLDLSKVQKGEYFT